MLLHNQHVDTFLDRISGGGAFETATGDISFYGSPYVNGYGMDNARDVVEIIEADEAANAFYEATHIPGEFMGGFDDDADDGLYFDDPEGPVPF